MLKLTKGVESMFAAIIIGALVAVAAGALVYGVRKSKSQNKEKCL